MRTVKRVNAMVDQPMSYYRVGSSIHCVYIMMVSVVTVTSVSFMRFKVF